jgi:hypothetical protein
MMKSALKLGAIGLLVAAIAGAPTQLLAQTTNKPAATRKSTAEKKAPSDKKRTGGGVHGNLAAIDGVQGEYVSLGYHATDDGKLNATTVKFGGPQAKNAENTKAEKKTEK